MAKKKQLVQVGKNTLELSNLSKVLFPDDGISKAEIIRYYLEITPTILKHVKGRPLTLIRFPDGIYGEQFYQKNRPDWAPDWVEYVTLGDEEKSIDYILATDQSTLVWLANLACIEMHQVHSRSPDLAHPDYIVYDLDPPEGYSFEGVVDIAFRLKDHLEGYGYHPFVKTTGRKGVHVLTPINARWDFHTAFEAAQDLAKPFVQSNGADTTLHIRKESRKGKVLIDIYRNRTSQSIVSAYSLRGVPTAPVSMPLDWDILADIDDPTAFDISNVLEYVTTNGDAWEAIRAYAVDIHTDRKKSIAAPRELELTGKFKTPDQLEEYEKKRSFDRTPEPEAVPGLGDGSSFVIHRHHASRLHYDLRIEENGALRSWAVPRGMPPMPGVLRLAVATEDHPLEYLTFEGEIPKGQYGGGKMWVYAQGRYEITKVKKKGFYFRIHSEQLSGEYRIHESRDKQWLLERVDIPQVDWLVQPIDFMLATSESEVPTGPDYLYEVKWDGIRAMITINDGEVTIRSRNQRDITAQFPELCVPELAFRGSTAILDGEIVCLDEHGKPNFRKVINRLQRKTESAIERGRVKNPVHCYVFDCLYLDGRPIINETLERRREWLTDLIKPEVPYRVSQVVEEGTSLFAAAREHNLEGIMAKDRTSRYTIGKRSKSWIKIKVRQTVDCVIIGYTAGKGDRQAVFGALHIATFDDGELTYVGKVGTGFNSATMKSIYAEIVKLQEVDKPIEQKLVDDAETVWIDPVLICEVQYASRTSAQTLREPVFVRLRPDLAVED
ncbi:MAG: hypothetical protein HKN43_11260 [Rhodothermales bacterium]|nr:hypothetical protein [Rhodothermales bacterium]